MKGLLKSIATKAAYFAAALIIIAAILVCVARFLAPILDEHRTDFEKMASQLLQTPVTIKSVRVSWFHYQPVIGLNDVTVFSKDSKKPVLQVKKVNILFSIPQSLWTFSIVPSGMMVSGANLTVSQSSTGKLTVEELSSLDINQQSFKSETQFSDVMGWLSQQPRLILRDIDVHYSGYNGQKRFVTLYDLSFENSGTEHSMLGKAILHQDLPTEITLASQWHGESTDLTKMQAQIYLYVSGLSVSQWLNGHAWQGWQVKDGVVSAKIWISLDNGKVQKIQSAFQSYGVKLYSQTDKSTHDINRLSGNLGWKRDGDNLIVAGDDIFLDLPEHLWPATSFYVSLSPDANGVLSPRSADVGYIDLVDVQSFLFSSPALITPSIRKMLDTLKINGSLQNTAMVFSGAWYDWKKMSLNANFRQLSLSPWQQYPGVTNLSGKVTWNGKQGELTLNSSRSVFRYDPVFSNPINIDQIAGDVQVKQDQNNSWILTSHALHLMNNDMTANVNGMFTIPENASPIADIRANFALQNASHVTRYLPLHIFDANLVDWLKNAFLAGEVKSGQAILRGPIDDFPFDKGTGLFSITANVSNIDFRFAPDWPIMRQISGSLAFTGRKISIDIDHALALGVPIGKVHGIIPYLGDEKPQVVQVQTTDIQTDFAQAMQYIHASPLEKTVGKMFSGVGMHGPITLKLGLTVPLKDPDKTHVQGDLTINHGEMDMTPWNLQLQQLTGNVKFTESTTQAKGIQAELFNKPVQFDLATVTKSKNLSVVRANFKNNLTISDLESWLKLPFSTVVSGSTDVTGAIDFSLTSPIEVHLASNLVGVSVNLIDEYSKQPQEARDFTADITVQENQPMRLRLGYDKLMNIAMTLDRKQNQFNLISADLRIGTGEAEWPTSPGFYISGEVETLDWEKIKSSINQSSGKNLSPSLLKGIDMSANHLIIGGRELTKIHLLATQEQDIWNVSISSEEMTGQIKLPLKLNRQAIISAEFEKINIHSESKTNQTSALFDLKSMPAISLVANDVRYNDMPLGQLTFKAIPSAGGLLIKALHLASSRIDMHATGEWTQNGNGYSTHLKGTATSSKVSEFLNSLGLDVRNFISNKGSLSFNLNWRDAPYTPSLSSINGQASLTLGQGRIVDIGQEGGAKMDLGRMLSIFSLQTIPRRLALDFSDVFQKGYSFDSVRGDFTVQDGDIFTHNMRFDGPVASVGINGHIGLKNKNYNFILAVTAHVTSSLPVAATLLTGNPLIGLGALAVNTVISSKVSGATTYYYSVTGPWNNPTWSPVKSAGNGSQRRLH